MIHTTPTSSTQTAGRVRADALGVEQEEHYCPATWARLAMTSTSAAMIPQPPAHPVRAEARVAQVNVVPQSGSACQPRCTR